MRIAVLGAGRVGTTLGGRWRSRGHDVVYGVRDPADPRYAGLGPVATSAEAVSGAEVVVLALPWAAVEEAVRTLDVAGAVVVDATNPLGAAGERSGAELVAEWTGARVAKAFNTTGWESMADPAYPGGAAAMLVAADDERAKEIALALAGELGFEAVDAGPLSAARELEALAALWIRLSRTGLGREFAFAILRRQS